MKTYKQYNIHGNYDICDRITGKVIEYGRSEESLTKGDEIIGRGTGEKGQEDESDISCRESYES